MTATHDGDVFAADSGPPGSDASPNDYRAVRLLVSALAAAICAAGAVLVLAGVTSAARPAVVLAGLVLGTGWAITGWLRLPTEPAYIGSVTLGTGVAVPIALAIILVLSKYWHPVGASGALLAVAAVVNAALVLRYAVGTKRPQLHPEAGP